MASVKRSNMLLKNEVIRRLERGNGNIKGLELLLAVEDTAVVPVKVVGISFSGKNGYRDGVHLNVEPIGGGGLLWVSPSALIDNTAAAKEIFRRRVLAAEEHKRVSESRSDRERTTLLIDMRVRMTEKQKKVFDELLPNLLGNKAQTDPVKALKSVTGEYESRNVAKRAACILHDVDSDLSDDY